MKKFFAIALALVMVLGLCACTVTETPKSTDAPKATNAPDANVTQAPETPAAQDVDISLWTYPIC